MSASLAPTGTVASTGTSIESRTPEIGAGISVSTLSVETSRSASSTVTLSPTRLSQRVTVPSETDSPRAGIETTVPVEDSAATAVGATGATGAAGIVAATATGGATCVTGGVTTGAAAGALVSDSVAMTASSAPTKTV